MSPRRVTGRLRVFFAATAIGLALAGSAQAGLKFTLPAPAAGSVVIAQVKGRSTGHAPPNLKLLNKGALGRTQVASATWHQKRGPGFDGIVVLLSPPNGSSGPSRTLRSATFTSATMVTVAYRAIRSTLTGLLLPQGQSARELARRTQCANNLKNIGRVVEQAQDNLTPGHQVRAILRQVCGAAMDETMFAAPQFWSQYGLPFCSFFMSRFGSAGSEFQFNGNCNQRVEALNLFPPRTLTATGCIPRPGSDCFVSQHQVSFSFAPSFDPYAAITGLRVRVGTPTRPSRGWSGRAREAGGTAFDLPIDPTARPPKFVF